jgi:hypothetical protein
MAIQRLQDATVCGNKRVRCSGDYLGIVIGKVAIGATGAVGTITTNGKVGITVTRSSAGVYVFTIPKGDITNFDAKVWGDAATTANNIFFTRVMAHTDADGTITIQNEVLNGTATDPSSGLEIRFQYCAGDGV